MGVLKKILLGLIVAAALAVGIAYLLPREVHVERSATIDAPPATVFALVNGFRRFNDWSPWAARDPDASYEFEGPDHGVGARMAWAGDPKVVGTGSQTIVESRPYELVAVELDFGPQGVARARYGLEPDGQGTRVTWGFDTDVGMNPVSRYFGLLFDRMIGTDYEQGLANLKALAESLPKADFAGLEVQTVDVAPVAVAYVEARSSRDEQEIAAAIGGAYGQIVRYLSANRLTQAGPPITINTEWDESGYVFDAAIPIDRAPEQMPAADSPVKIKRTWGGRALKVVHRGAYREMPATYDKLFAWAAAHGHEQAAPPWDEYVSDPARTPEPELITNVYLPID